MDELFGAGAYELPIGKAASDSGNGDEPLVDFDTPPAPVGGMGAIGEKIRYPAAARDDGIEGEVIVEVGVSEEERSATCGCCAACGTISIRRRWRQ